MVDNGGDYTDVDYSPHHDEDFNVWTEIGALHPEEQHRLADDPSRMYIIKVKSSSPEAEQLIHQPLAFLLEHSIPDVNEESRVTTTVFHHERGLNYRIIRAKATVEGGTGDVSMTLDKET
jgi:hypothetical protein